MEQSPGNEANDRYDFATLWAESYERLRTYVRIFVTSSHDSEDVIQETAMAIARDFKKYDPERPFLEWAVGIARNRVLQYYRKRGRDRQMVFGIETIKLIENSFLSFEPRTSVYHDALEECLSKLPPRSRHLVHLRYLSCLCAEEIAEQVGFTIQSVYTRLSQIRTGLRECINRQMRLMGELE